jgi:hypothetical protein
MTNTKKPSLSKSEEIAAFKAFIAVVGTDSYFADIATPAAVLTIESNIKSDFPAFLGVMENQRESDRATDQIKALKAEIAELKKHDIRALRIQHAKAQAMLAAARDEAALAAARVATAESAAAEAVKALAI